MNKQKDTSCLNFPTRSGDYAEVLDHGDLDFGTDPFSIECWAQFGFMNNSDLGIPGSSLNIILTNGHASSSSIKGFNLLTNAYDFVVRIGDGGGTNDRSYTVPGTPVVGNWYHVVVTRSGTTIETYVDGEDVGGDTNAGWGANVSSDNTFRISDDTSNSRDYKWPVDGVKIYSKALSSAEVSRNYKATKGSHRN